jgi:SOS-response transcriptional repressor LexA
MNKKVYTRKYQGVALTEKQYEVMMYILNFRSARGVSPSAHDFMREFRFAGPNGIRSHLVALQVRGLIDWTPGKARTIRPTGSIAVDVPADLVADVRAFIASKVGER